MKKVLLMCCMLTPVCMYAQTRKKPVKKATVAPAPPADPDAALKASLTAGDAGKFAKDFGARMYNGTNLEREKGGYSLSINGWKPWVFDDGTKKTAYYLIDVTVRWKTSQGGWPVSWHDVEYNGILFCDQFGCEPNYLVKTKTEPSCAGLARLVVRCSPTGELDQQHQDGFANMDDWFAGVKYVYNPGSCLNN